MELDDFKAILKRLSNKHTVEYDVGVALHKVLAQLRSGSDAEQALAKILVESLTFTGSDEMREFVLAVHAAINTKQGRAAAGLPAKKRGREYDTNTFDTDTPEWGTLMAYHMDDLNQKDAVTQLGAIVGLTLDRRTFLSIYNEMKPRLEKVANLPKSGN